MAQLKTLGRKAWKDLAEAKDQLGARIATNTGNITKLSTRVGTNERDIVGLKRDVDTNDTRIRYLYDNMPFRHFISVNEKNTNKTSPNYKNNGAKNVGSIAIGVNTAAYGDDAVALGGNSFVRGQGSVIVGESSDNYTGGLDAKEGQFDQSIILGSNNTIFAQSAENGGREDKIIGNMNRVEESHGTFVRGTGNMVYDAYNDEALTDDDKQKEQDFLDPIDGGDPIGLFQKGRSHVTVEGDGNMVAGSLYTQVSGVGNEVSNSQPDENGPSTPRVTYNIVTGNRNTVVDSSHNLIIGDNHELEKVNGNIIIGSLQTKAKTEASNVTILGNDANVSVEGGVALGTGSVASTAAGVFGYDPATDKASTTDNATWKSGNGAVSVGTQDKTRQIINLAAGTADTDAVNVAQLKNSKTAVEAGDYVTVTKKAEDGKGTTYTVKGPKLTSVDTNLTVTDEEETVAGTTDKKKVGYKLELSKTLTGLESVSSKVFKAGDNVTLGETGLTITGGPSVTTTGIDANNTIITNVAAGAADTDAVNFGQLKDVKSIATTNEGNITKLKAGFIVKDGGKGKADVTLGGDTKQEVTFKAAVDKTTQATADTKSLSSSVDADRNVTYTLNMSQLKKDLGITEGTDGVMSSWKLKATGGDTTPQEIKNGEAVTFDVAAADKGLTVTRDGKTIKYGIEGSKIDLDGNTSITNLSNEIEKSKIHYFSVKSDDSANPAGTNWKNDGASGENAIAIGKDAKAKTKASVVVGLNASSDGAANDGVAVGNTASVTGFGGVAIGRGSSAEGQETVAIGAGAKGVIHRTVAIGGQANAGGFGAVAIGRDSSSNVRGVSVGIESNSKEFAVSVGTNSFSNFRSVAVGELANAESKYSVAVGDQTASYAEAGVTLGNKTRVYGDSSVAIGNEARVSGKPLTEAEFNALPDAEKPSYKVQIARYPNPADPDHPTIEKTYFKVFNAADWNAQTHYNSIAIGTTSFVEAKEAIGIGAATWIHGDRGVALGYTATSGEKGTALGAGAQAKANAGVALGEGAVADTAAEVAGYDPKTGKASTETTPTWKSVKGAVSVGNADATRQITNLAAGKENTDAVNVAQLKAAQTHYFSVNADHSSSPDGTNYNNDGAKGENAMAAGVGANAKGKYATALTGGNAGGDYSFAVGRETTASGDYSTAMGSETTAGGEASTAMGSGTTAGGIYSTAMGVGTTASGEASTAMGVGTTAGGIYSTAMGVGTTAGGEASTAMGSGTTAAGISSTAMGIGTIASGDYSTAMGNGSVAGAENSLAALGGVVDDAAANSAAMGQGAKAAVADAVALGSKSVADRTAGVVGYDAKSADHTADTTGTWKSTQNAIAVGDAANNITRQITGVAAGSAGTDAVNVAQLKAVNDKLGTTINDAAKWTIKDSGNGKKVINKDNDLVVKGDDYITSTVNNSGLSLTMNEDKLNTAITSNTTVQKNKTDISNINTSVTNITNNLNRGFVLRAGTTDSTGKTIALDGDETLEIRFNVAEEGKGLTVTRDENTVKYGIDGSKIDLTGNTAITNITNNLSQASAWKLQVNGGSERTIGKDNVVNFKNGTYTEVTATGDDVMVDLNKDAKDKLAKVDTLEGQIKANKVQVTGDAATGVKVADKKEADGSTTYKVSLDEKIQVGGVAVNGKDGKGEVTGLTNTSLNVAGFATSKRAATEEQLQAAMTQMSANAKITTVESGDENIVVKETKGQNENKYTVALNKNLNVDSLNAGGTQVNKDGISVRGADGKSGVTITKDGIDAGGQTIRNVKPGENIDDAATVGQLKDLAGAAGNGLNELGNQIGRLDGRVNKVGAGAAALAALHPVDFDADDKLDVAAGWGHYKGRNAMALGAFYRPDERTMFSLGGTVGNGENMINAGITFKLDKRRGPIHAITSKVQLVQEVTQLKADNDELRKDNAELREQMKEINAKLEKLMAAK